ncbi:MAG: diguanylate cyclase [Sandaracinaceae bacterium]
MRNTEATSRAPDGAALPAPRATVRPSGDDGLEAGASEAPAILIVDDDPWAIRILQLALDAYRDVRFATSAAEASRLLAERSADLIFLDAEMPGESGFEFCARLQRDPVLRAIPVIFVTAHDDMAFEQRALESGASDFIVKPVNAPRVQLRARLHLKLKQQMDKLQEMAATDCLTGLMSRRSFDETLERELASARRGGRPLSLLWLDVDFLEHFNDSYGHPAGDDCLRRIAEALRAACRRQTDMVARVGGDEFAVLLPDTPNDGARIVAESVRAAVAAMRLPHRHSTVAPHVTVSVGVASVGDAEARAPEDAQALLQVADGALYLAKQRGRDRVAVAPDEGIPS